MKCKQCITDKLWVKLLPEHLLKKCSYCGEVGMPLTKILKIAGTISVLIYFISLTFALI